MKPLGAVRLLMLAGMFSISLVAYGLSARSVHTWNTSITATGQVQVGEFEPLDAIVELRPDSLVVTEGAQSLEAVVEIPAADVLLVDPGSIRLCVGNDDCGGSGAVATWLEVDSRGRQLVLGFADYAAAGLPMSSESDSDAEVIRLAVSGSVAGRTFVGSVSLALAPSPAESPTVSEPTGLAGRSGSEIEGDRS